jgi:type IV pilus assembly protein PilE
MQTIDKNRGFTLIELVVAVTVMAILTIMAMSSYQTSVQHSRRTDAKTALNDLASREQRYFSVTNQYTASPLALGYSSTATTFGTAFTIGNGYYTLAVAAPTGGSLTPAPGVPASFIATATAIGNQVKDAACATLSVDSFGNYTSTGTGTASPPCWP